MNIKKIGLTALAASLVSVSAHAGEMSVAGGASIGLKNTSKSSSGKSWTMGNQLTFTGSGELDNGMNVSLSFVLDQADDSTTGIANAPFDSHSVTVSSDSLGTLVFSGEGGSSAQSAIDTTAAGDAWDNGSGITTPRASEAGNNSLLYTLPSIMDDLTIKASYSPGGAGGESATAWHVGYSGVEGLSLDYAVGQTETVGSEEEHTTMKASYAYSSFTLSYSNTENAYDAASGTDYDAMHYGVSFAVNDDLSVSYDRSISDKSTADTDETINSLQASYTMGSMTVKGHITKADDEGYSAGASDEHKAIAVSWSF